MLRNDDGMSYNFATSLTVAYRGLLKGGAILPKLILLISGKMFSSGKKRSSNLILSQFCQFFLKNLSDL